MAERIATLERERADLVEALERVAGDREEENDHWRLGWYMGCRDEARTLLARLGREA